MTLRRFSLAAGVFPLLALLLASAARGQLAELVVELDQGLLPLGTTATVGGYVEARGLDRLFFTARAPETGWEVWTTDGSAAGTRLLGDFCPGPCALREPPEVHSVDDRAVWISPLGPDNSEDGFALLSSDGTSQGIHFLLGPEELHPFSTLGTVFNGIFVFSTPNGLWRTDGTPAGTFLLHAFPSDAREFTPVGSELFFLTDGELWATDGTVGGTRRVNLLPGILQPEELRFNGARLFLTAGSPGDPGLYVSPPEGSSFRPLSSLAGAIDDHPGLPVVRGRHVYLTTFQQSVGEELWRTDGTPQGTRRITDFAEVLPFGELTADRIQVMGDRVVFSARADGGGSLETVWATDGTVGGQRKLIDCPEGGDCAPLAPGTGLHPVGDRVVFPVVGSGCGQRIFTTDGTPAGTRTMQGALGGSCATNLDNARSIGNELYFLAHDGRVLVRPWKTDGTPAGTVAVTEGARGPRAQNPPGRWIAQTSRGLVFTLASFEDDDAPWVGEPSSGENRRLIDLFPGRLDTTAATQLSLGEGTVFHIPFFVRFNRPFDEAIPGSVWFSRGTAETTELLTVEQVFGEPVLRSRAIGLAFFTDDDQQGGPTALRATDGTSAGTRTLEVFDGPDNGLEAGPRELAGSATFWARDDGVLELWRTDGTAAGTVPVRALDGEHVETASEAAAGLLFFETEERFDAGPVEEHSRLWATDGTAAGTRLLRDFGRQRGEVVASDFTQLGGGVLFLLSESDQALGRVFQIWRTDGTAAGTAPISDARFLGPPIPENLTVYRGEAYFVAQGLWRTDGTEQGTVSVFPAALSPDFSCEGPGVVFEDRLYLPLFHPLSGCELWVSDGTAAGTELVADLLPGPASSAPRELLVAGSSLFFSANDGVHGRELWQLATGEEAPRLAHDLWPGGESSQPELLATAGDDLLLFFADDGLRGRELWRLPLEAGAPPCRASGTALCLQDDRFRLEAEWKDFAGRRGSGRSVALTPDTGTFWFFSRENVEVMLKVLDGGLNNGHFWTFFGALSNVEYWLTVTDSETGAARRYYNPPRTFASIGDTFSFGPLGASLTGAPETLSALPSEPPTVLESRVETSVGGTDEGTTEEECVPTAQRLCLNGGRFAVEATFANFQGQGGVATAIPLTDDTGTFWFFRETNLELVVKVLDGQPVNGHYWVFYGSLSNVDFDLTVTDTATGRIRTYQNRSRTFASVGDTAAFEGP